MKENLRQIVGANVSAVLISERELVFQTDRGLIGYRVDGDCCSWSFFYDFYGVQKLVDNGKVIGIEEVNISDNDDLYIDSDCKELKPSDPDYHRKTWDVAHLQESDQQILVYGYRFTTVSSDWGLMSSVVSFRNNSNGYYGGWMEPFEVTEINDSLKLITGDVWIADHEV